MIISEILNPNIQDFILSNIDTDVTQLALQKNPFKNHNWQEILTQIVSKKKAKDKLPTWFNASNIIYPSKIAIEQTSSEKTALYKSRIVSDNSLIDLTGGFGIDDYYFSKKMKEVIHCEINAELSEIVNHNFKVLQQNNIECITGDSYQILQNLNRQFDYIYIDPSRRSNTKGKVFMLKDCLPNVPENLDFYFNYTSKILIKTAPILDITAAMNELKAVKSIHIVAVNNEVKELLWEIEKNNTSKTVIKTINFNKDKEETFEFILGEIPKIKNYVLPQIFLYEPNAAILKSGGFDLISSYFNISKLHQHSHLYTSNEIIAFPGRVFKIENSFEYTKPLMKQYLENAKANISTRNFPETVENIRKKWKIKEGGDIYVFLTTYAGNTKIVLICSKL
jgi:hypothetical protein